MPRLIRLQKADPQHTFEPDLRSALTALRLNRTIVALHPFEGIPEIYPGQKYLPPCPFEIKLKYAGCKNQLTHCHPSLHSGMCNILNNP
ncbi:hypothetical protein NTGZN8_180073 [Candidatus Nitrotoga fabula]|uniref:Uncharacterized protein n=1 Tax=Candidatus Nitrotoga fabula TaxID=2182327 RepID=A0A916FBN6_9PROT|nr:hypothetical protein NTGZN8_180073 [Candidatus Nitrotoga fabula]